MYRVDLFTVPTQKLKKYQSCTDMIFIKTFSQAFFKQMWKFTQRARKLRQPKNPPKKVLKMAKSLTKVKVKKSLLFVRTVFPNSFSDADALSSHQSVDSTV